MPTPLPAAARLAIDLGGGEKCSGARTQTDDPTCNVTLSSYAQIALENVYAGTAPLVDGGG